MSGPIKMNIRLALPALSITALLMTPQAHAGVTGDAVRGKTAFAVCAACHSVVANKNGIGPSLFGVAGRKAGTAPGYTYSAAMKAAAAWTPQQLDAYLTHPKATVPGNKMPFNGVTDAQKRADIIAYLATLK